MPPGRRSVRPRSGPWPAVRWPGQGGRAGRSHPRPHRRRCSPAAPTPVSRRSMRRGRTAPPWAVRGRAQTSRSGRGPRRSVATGDRSQPGPRTRDLLRRRAHDREIRPGAQS
ncbi:hypothetical protein ACFFX0_30125 [Citricoccus parietis]|uniref:Uncharacterized protein n=1 Tax=Citricoccus parietis TaxID=592307 RepID=A0ABV5FVW4_9MICC